MGTPAWQVRECERRQLIQSLVAAIYNQDDALEDSDFLFKLLLEIIDYLREPGLLIITTGGGTIVEKFTHEYIIIPIKEFGRSEAETLFCLVRLTEEILKAATSRMCGDLQGEEIHEPAKIFSAGSAMTEVPLEEYLIDDPKR